MSIEEEKKCAVIFFFKSAHSGWRRKRQNVSEENPKLTECTELAAFQGHNHFPPGAWSSFTKCSSGTTLWLVNKPQQLDFKVLIRKKINNLQKWIEWIWLAFTVHFHVAEIHLQHIYDHMGLKASTWCYANCLFTHKILWFFSSRNWRRWDLLQYRDSVSA